jgi:hypothetical protein
MISIKHWLKSRQHQESDEARRAMALVRGMLDAEMNGLKLAMQLATAKREANDATS